MKKHLPNLALTCVTLLILWLAAEAGYLVIRYMKFGTFDAQRIITRDLGWRTTPHYQSGVRTWQDAAGQEYERSFQTADYGFREWGNTSSSIPRFFFVGDSYTECNEVSNEKTYYSVFQNVYPEEIEVFAYGGGGYGTLQEYMIIDQHIDEINPDAVIVQFCSNDWQNNSLELESKTIVLNQTIRPYLLNNEIAYRFSAWHPYPALLKYSGVFSFIDTRVQGIRVARNGGSYFIEPTADAEWDRSIETTSQIFKRIRERVPATVDLFVFSCASRANDERYSDYERIARTNGFRPLPDVMGEVMKTSEASGQAIRALDGAHLNNAGNELLGEKLAAEIFRMRKER